MISKNTRFLFMLGSLLMLTSTSLHAQLNFFNGTNCTVTLKAVVENSGFPCSQTIGSTCVTATVTVGPNSTVVLPTGSCAIPMSAQGYRAIKFSLGGGIVGVVDKCNGSNPVNLLDCQGVPRQFRIVNPTFAAVY